MPNSTDQQNALHPATVLQPGEHSFNDAWEFLIDFTGEIAPRLFEWEGAPRWERVELPHTARLEPLVTTSQWQGTCLYRKFISVADNESGQYTAVRFDAAMHEARVYLDGKLIAEHAGGYLPFTVDLTGRLVPGQTHCLLIWLNNCDNPLIPPGKPVAGLDFHYYSGLYRGAVSIVQDKLRLTDPVAAGRVAGGGVRLHFEGVTHSSAAVCVKTEVFNGHADQRDARVSLMLLDSAGKQIGGTVSMSVALAPGEYGTLFEKIKIDNPRLWLPDDPYLYCLKVELMELERPLAGVVMPVGVRTVSFAADGFRLNGEKLWLRGANRHQEYPYIGNALSDRAQWRDAWKIKSGGFNFVRCSHYPPAPAFLDACDALGLMVMDSIPGWQFFGGEEFQRRALQDVRDMVRRDRHHPSIVIWEPSLNETDMSRGFMELAHKAVLEELPEERPFTSGFIAGPYDLFGPARAHDRTGHYWRNYDKTQPLFVAEHGDWEYYADNAGFQQSKFGDLKREERSSRQLRGFGEKRLAQQARNFQESSNDILQGPALGDAIWVMFDYNRGYAADIESSGIMDIFRLPKPVFYFYQSQAGPRPGVGGFGGPMVHIANNWTATSATRVVVYSNCEEVELLLDGRTIGRQRPDSDSISDHLLHPPFTFALDAFTPGTLSAVGYIGGRQEARTLRRTPGEPHALNLTADLSGQPLKAGINDVVFVYAEVVDRGGTVVPGATNAVRFEIAGDATLVGDNPITVEAGIATILLRAGRTAGQVKLTASAEHLTPGRCLLTVEA